MDFFGFSLIEFLWISYGFLWISVDLHPIQNVFSIDLWLLPMDFFGFASNSIGFLVDV